MANQYARAQRGADDEDRTEEGTDEVADAVHAAQRGKDPGTPVDRRDVSEVCVASQVEHRSRDAEREHAELEHPEPVRGCGSREGRDAESCSQNHGPPVTESAGTSATTLPIGSSAATKPAPGALHVQPGDVVECRIPGVGVLRNRVVAG